jgi:predicted component of type VI protein secretion system
MRYITLILAVMLVGCASSGKDTPAFDVYLDQLMAEPYNPNEESN